MSVPPSPPVSPSEMTANVTSSDYNEERKEIFAGFITLYYDALNQRIRTDDFYIDIPKPNERARFSIIVDHKQVGNEYPVSFVLMVAIACILTHVVM